MSIDYNIYAGPVLIYGAKQVEVDASYHSCPNIKCSSHKAHISSKFCNVCGTKIELLHQTEMEASFPDYELEDLTAVYGMCGLEFLGDDERLYIPDGECPRDFLGDARHDEYYIDSDELDISKEVEWFKETFKEQIAELEKTAADVSIKWAIFTWAS